MTLSIHLLAFTVYQYVASVLLGVVRDLLALRFWTVEHDMAPLLSDWSSFYERRVYSRIRDCFNRTVASSPSSWILLSHQGRQTWALNLGSYNYLGFGDHESVCTAPVLAALHSQGACLCSHRSTAGTSPQLLELERAVAEFIGQPAALVCGMGFATNANIIPLLVGRGALIVSDELNHTSIAVGARLSGAKVATFRHNGLFGRAIRWPFFRASHEHLDITVFPLNVQILSIWNEFCANQSSLAKAIRPPAIPNRRPHA